MVTEILNAPPLAAVHKEVRAGNVCPAPAVARQRVGAPEQDRWVDMKTLLEIGFAVVRVVELAILFA